MKKINNKTLPRKEKFDGVTIGDELTGPERVEYICNHCHQNLVKISDRQGNNEEWFCRTCSIGYADTQQIRHKQRISVPDRNEETLVTCIQHDYNKDVEIRHTPELRGGIAALSKKGTIRITKFEDSSQR